MSAFMVSNEHINMLVWSATRRVDPHRPWSLTTSGGERTLHVGNAESRAALGQFLWEANLASLRARYGDEETAEPYEYAQPRWRRWSALEAARALACFEYQACEIPDWATSETREVCQGLRDHYLDLAILDAGIQLWSVEEDSLPAMMNPA